MVVFFPVLMVTPSGRLVPMQALITTVPEPARRGAFLSTISALQALGSSFGAWIGGSMLSSTDSGHIEGYGTNGWVAVALVGFCMLWVSKVRGASEQLVKRPATRENVGEA
jgi:DHA1 family inner membrane transport protein